MEALLAACQKPYAGLLCICIIDCIHVYVSLKYKKTEFNLKKNVLVCML